MKKEKDKIIVQKKKKKLSKNIFFSYFDFDDPVKQSEVFIVHRFPISKKVATNEGRWVVGP